MKSQKIKIIITSALAIAVLFFLLNKSIRLAQTAPVTIESGYRQVMGTFAKIMVTAKTKKIADESITSAYAEIDSVDKMMSNYDSNSLLSFVNANAFNKPIKVDPELFYVLQKSVEYSRLSGGAFDITVGPLITLWKQCAEANALPTQAQLAEAHKKTGYQKLILDANDSTVKFAAEGMTLDVGAIAKGYSIDLAVETIKKCGGAGAMVDIGGDIRCFGKSPGRDGWVVALQDPTKKSADLGDIISKNSTLLKFRLTNESVATSGDYERYETIGGKRYSHIINPATETSADTLSSVTIFAAKAIDADAMATTVSVLGAKKGMELIEKTPGIEGILIPKTDKTKLIKSSGADKYITN